jgi:hypothetical protein
MLIDMRVNPKITLSYAFKETGVMLLLIPLTYVGLLAGEYDFQRWTKFRDKSALYGGMKAPGEKPSW